MFYRFQLSNVFSTENGHNISTRLFCGTISGLMACLLTQPFDVIKTMVQLYPERFSTVGKSAKIIYKAILLKLKIIF